MWTPNIGIVTPDALESGFNKTGAQAAIVIAPYGITTDFHAHEAICQRLGKLLIIDNAAGLGVARAHLAFSGVGDSGKGSLLSSCHKTVWCW